MFSMVCEKDWAITTWKILLTLNFPEYDLAFEKKSSKFFDYELQGIFEIWNIRKNWFSCKFEAKFWHSVTTFLTLQISFAAFIDA